MSSARCKAFTLVCLWNALSGLFGEPVTKYRGQPQFTLTQRVYARCLHQCNYGTNLSLNGQMASIWSPSHSPLAAKQWRSHNSFRRSRQVSSSRKTLSWWAQTVPPRLQPPCQVNSLWLVAGSEGQTEGNAACYQAHVPQQPSWNRWVFLF